MAKAKVAEDLLCALIQDDPESVDGSLLLNGEFQEILDVAVERMNDDQKLFYESMINDDNSRRFNFLSGLPGTGKSYLEKALHLYLAIKKEECDKDPDNVQFQNFDYLCVAPTNYIAFQQQGITIHKALRGACDKLKIANYKIEEDLVQAITLAKFATSLELKRMTVPELERVILRYFNMCDDFSPDNYIAHLSKSCLAVKTILIDEGSMVSSLLLAMLSVHYPQSKFIIMYGPNQLPPINDFPSCDEAFDDNSDQTFFHSLQTQMRFDSECSVFNDFVAFFSDYLSGKVDQNDKLAKIKYFYNALSIGGTLDDYQKLSEDKILIVSTNKQRCQENDFRLLKEKRIGRIYEIDAIYDNKKLKNYNIESNLGIDKKLKITIGVKCIVKCNDLNNGLIKGMVVEIIDVIENSFGQVDEILVKTSRNNKILSVRRYSFDVRGDTVQQFPLALFYSLTAHSTQGKTLDCKVGVSITFLGGNEILYKKAFFVAVTRIRHPKQLFMNKHPVFFLEPSLSINTLRDIEEVEQDINDKPQLKKQKMDIPLTSLYNVSKLVQYVKTC